MSRILKETEEEIEALYNLGVVSEDDYENVIKHTAKRTQIPSPKVFEGEQILAIRQKLKCSQKVFADILGVTADTISKWERDVRHPEKTACRLLQIIEKEGLAVLR